MKDLQNDNLNTFVGMNLNYENKVAILWQFHSKGSLEDILFNDEINLDSIFKAAILTDILKVLRFILSAFHGKC